MNVVIGSNQPTTAEKTLHECKCTKNSLNELETELNSVRDSRDKLQEENNRLIDQQYKADYRITNLEKRINYFVEQVEKYEAENKHLKGLVKLWLSN